MRRGHDRCPDVSLQQDKYEKEDRKRADHIDSITSLLDSIRKEIGYYTP